MPAMASYGIHLYCPNLSAATRQSVLDHWGKSLRGVSFGKSWFVHIYIYIYVYTHTHIITHYSCTGWVKVQFISSANCIFFWPISQWLCRIFPRKISQIMASSWLVVAIKADQWTVKWQRYAFGFSVQISGKKGCFPKAFFFGGEPVEMCIIKNWYMCMENRFFFGFLLVKMRGRKWILPSPPLWDDCFNRFLSFFPLRSFQPRRQQSWVQSCRCSQLYIHVRGCLKLWKLVPTKKHSSVLWGFPRAFWQFPSKESISNEGRRISVWEGSFTPGSGSKVKIPNSVHILVLLLGFQTLTQKSER